MAISGSETHPHGGVTATRPASSTEVESVKCHSCGFSEDCTPAYIHRVRDRYQGRWICGLCVEAVKDEVLRSGRLISTEEALDRHIRFCREFRSSSPPNPASAADHPISAMGRRLRRSLDATPRPLRSNSSVELRQVDDGIRRSSLVRSGSCVS